jgi:1-acyl-sn-glycerol-3-phosphate acyltransferase
MCRGQKIPAGIGLECAGPGLNANGKQLIRKVSRQIQGLVTFTVITINTIFWFVPLITFALFKLLLPVPGFRRLMTRWIMAMGENWVTLNAKILSMGNSTAWDVRGIENLSPQGWYLVLVNHQTWTDIVALQTVFNRRIPFLKFFIKQQLIWFPLLGVAWWAMDMPFMKRHSKSYLARHPDKKGEDLEATRIACEKFRDTPTSVINFIEGTRSTEAKRARRNSPFTHLLPPRAGGIALALSSMGSMFDAILDVTIVYPTGPTQFWDMMCGDFDRVIIDIVKRPVEQWMIAGDYSGDRDFRSRFHRWLTGLWNEKDARISQIYAESAA